MTCKVNILVEGNIGSGKSTLIDFLGKNPLFTALHEPVEEWQSIRFRAGFVNFLDEYYRNPERNGIPFQFFVLLSLYKRQLATSSFAVRIFERSQFSSRYVFAQAGLRFQPTIVESLTLNNYYDFFEQLFPFHPDLIIYLKTSPETAFNRIQNRGRREESSIRLQDIYLLDQLHEEWLTSIWKDGPVLTINANKSLSDLKVDFEDCERKIVQIYNSYNIER